jgi:hypothetical protein
MSLVVYAIVDSPSPEIEERGLDGRPLRTVTQGELAAVVSKHDAPRVARSAANLWDYEQVMERLMAGRTILPMRFGTVLSDERETLAMIRKRALDLQRALDRLRGAVELGIRAGWREPPEPSGPNASGAHGRDGMEYMLKRLALHRQVSDLVDRLDPLATLARDIRLQLLGRDEHPVRKAYLVNREHVEEFTERVREIDERHPEIELVCTGPWPPYSFATGGGGHA